MSPVLLPLIFILALTAPVMYLGRRFLAGSAIPQVDFDRRCIAWFAILGVAFLSRNFWVFMSLSALIMLWLVRRDENPFAAFLMLFLAAPPTTSPLPGFGGIAYFIELNHLRLLSLVVLGVGLLKVRRRDDYIGFGKFGLDWLILAYVALRIALLSRSDVSATVILRATVETLIDVALPYMLASRAFVSLQRIRESVACLVLAILLTAPVSVYEFAKGWLLYVGLDQSLGIGWDTLPYIIRNGNVRPVGPAGISLVFGFVLFFGVAMNSYAHVFMSKRIWILSFAALIAALGTSLARGSYIGAALALCIVAATGRNASERLAKLVGGTLVAAVAVALSPFAEHVIDYLPFVGSVDEGNVTYRQVLFDISMKVIDMNPLLGSNNFLANPLMEELRQGQGIIDVVNSYLGIALASGYIGLGLYLSILAVALVYLISGIGKSGSVSAELELFGRTLLGALVGTMVILATTSNIMAMPFLIWILIGWTVKYQSFVRQFPLGRLDDRVDDRMTGRVASPRSGRASSGHGWA